MHAQMQRYQNIVVLEHLLRILLIVFRKYVNQLNLRMYFLLIVIFHTYAQSDETTL